VKAVLADALAGRALAANEWRMLAFYSWETDEQQLVSRTDLPGTLVQLAVASPAADPETTTRLWLKSLAASDDGQGVKPDAALRERVLRVLADPAQSRTHMDVLANGAAEIVKALEPDAGAGRGAVSAVSAAFDAALERLQADTTLSRGDRMEALISRLRLARLDLPKDTVHLTLPGPLLEHLREQVARADREITDGYERMAVITAAGHALGLAGLWGESDALLKANLARSHAPYYLMTQLGRNAGKLGRKEEALRWYAQAFDKSEGPATRLQWGASYLSALVELAPQDRSRIEKTAARLIDEAARDSAAFEGRSARSLRRVSSKLESWNADGKQAATLKRLQLHLGRVCARLDSADVQRATCLALLKPASSKA
jgi:hypothetical protein